MFTLMFALKYLYSYIINIVITTLVTSMFSIDLLYHTFIDLSSTLAYLFHSVSNSIHLASYVYNQIHCRP